MLQGFDVGVPQGHIDWSKVPADRFRFFFARCGNGNDSPDAFWDQNYAGALWTALPIGTYHVLFPLPHLSPEAQAESHWRVQGQKRDICPMADLEWPQQYATKPRNSWAYWGCSAPQIRDWTLRYLNRMRSLAGNCGLYTYPDYRRSISAELSPVLGSFPLWEASYGMAPTPFPPWPGWSVWQQSGGGLIVPGIASKVDGDAIVDENALARLRE